MLPELPRETHHHGLCSGTAAGVTVPDISARRTQIPGATLAPRANAYLVNGQGPIEPGQREGSRSRSWNFMPS